MQNDKHTGTISRRSFIAAAAALPLGCALGHRSPSSTAGLATVRQPAVGQSWRYAKHDLFTKALIDTEVNTVSAVGKTVDIAAHAEASTTDHDSASANKGWLSRYFERPRPGGPLPSEVQEPWGMVLIDPHWGQVQIYAEPLPLWPIRLEPGWQTHILTKYRTADEEGLPWEQTMKAESWESVTVPAGSFRTLKYTNYINFTSSDPSRANSVRRETVWLAPELGRWVARESRGTYYFDESVADDQYNESSYRWELLGFT